ncbi:MAG TPA: DNA gyrase modulator [Candidatus Cloacimonadota bacterium]|nr:DNA gyrase modulator [Candidatus Cloacimonadota bacterium]
MIDKLKAMVGNLEADYFDIRYESKRVDRLLLSKSEIRECGSNREDGFVLRVLTNGSLASVSFTKPEQAGLAIRKALENAKAMALLRKCL